MKKKLTEKKMCPAGFKECKNGCLCIITIIPPGNGEEE